MTERLLPSFIAGVFGAPAPMSATKLQLLQAASAADKAWMSEVVRLFGKRDAGVARFHDQAQGEPGSTLRALFDAYVTTRDAYADRLVRATRSPAR